MPSEPVFNDASLEKFNSKTGTKTNFEISPEFVVPPPASIFRRLNLQKPSQSGLHNKSSTKENAAGLQVNNQDVQQSATREEKILNRQLVRQKVMDV